MHAVHSMHLWKDDGGDEERKRDIPAIGIIQQRFTLPPTVSDPHLSLLSSSLKSIPSGKGNSSMSLVLSLHVHVPEPFHDQMQKMQKYKYHRPLFLVSLQFRSDNA